MNENTFVDSSFFQFDVFCLFFVFWAILTSSTYFFVELQQKKRKLKNLFWAPEFGRPNRYTGRPNGLNMSLKKSYGLFKHTISLHTF